MDYTETKNTKEAILRDITLIWEMTFEYQKTANFNLMELKDKRLFKKIENTLFQLMKEYKYNSKNIQSDLFQ